MTIFFGIQYKVFTTNVNFTISKKDCPRKRLDAVYDLCKGKTICEGGDDLEKVEKSPIEEEDQPKVKLIFLNMIYLINFNLTKLETFS